MAARPRCEKAEALRGWRSLWLMIMVMILLIMIYAIYHREKGGTGREGQGSEGREERGGERERC